MACTNMILFNREGRIRLYETANDILEEFAIVRLEYYVKRKDYLVDKLNREKVILDAKVFRWGLMGPFATFQFPTLQETRNRIRALESFRKLFSDAPKVKFIMLLLAGRLEIKNKKKAVVIEELLKHDFKPWSEIQKGKKGTQPDDEGEGISDLLSPVFSARNPLAPIGDRR